MSTWRPYTVPHVGKNSACSVSWPEVVNDVPNQGVVCSVTYGSSLCLSFVFLVYVVLCLVVFSCQYQCSWLPGKTRLRNDLLCVEWDVKPYTHTHSLTDDTLLLMCLQWTKCDCELVKYQTCVLCTPIFSQAHWVKYCRGRFSIRTLTWLCSENIHCLLMLTSCQCPCRFKRSIAQVDFSQFLKCDVL